jgi:predicted transcriptional regulator of viral defense system
MVTMGHGTTYKIEAFTYRFTCVDCGFKVTVETDNKELLECYTAHQRCGCYKKGFDRKIKVDDVDLFWG